MRKIIYLASFLVLSAVAHAAIVKDIDTINSPSGSLTLTATSLLPLSGSATGGFLSSASFNYFTTAAASASNAITSLTGQVTASGPGAAAATLLNSAVTGQSLIGFVSGAGVVSAADSILTAIDKLDGNIATKQIALNSSPAVANQFLTGFTATNTFTRATVDFTNLSGTASLAQLPSIQYPNEKWIQASSGSDVTGDGSFQRPWQSLFHACATASTPVIFHISGGDASGAPIVCPSNISIIGDSPGNQINQDITITASAGNDLVTLSNLNMFGTFTWVKNDASSPQLTIYNTTIQALTTFQQNGAGPSAFLYMNIGALVGLDIRANQATLVSAGIYGPINYSDSGAGSYLIMQNDDIAASISLNGGITTYLAGSIADIGYSINATTTGSGTPAINADSGSLPTPANITGAYSLVLNAWANYVNYTPTTPSDWSPIPSTVSMALDILGARTNNAGTVSSVALSLPSIFGVSGSPITSSGTLSATLSFQSANTVFAGPTAGAAASPSFRALVAADIPSISTLTNYFYVDKSGADSASCGSIQAPCLTVGQVATNIGAAASNAQFNDATKRYYEIKVTSGVYTESPTFGTRPYIILNLDNATITGNVTIQFNQGGISGAGLQSPHFIIKGSSVRAVVGSGATSGITGNIIYESIGGGSSLVALLEESSVAITGSITQQLGAGGGIFTLTHFVHDSIIQGAITNSGGGGSHTLYVDNVDDSSSNAIGAVTGVVNLNILSNVRFNGIVAVSGGQTGRWFDVEFKAALAHNFTGASGTITADANSYASYFANVPTKGTETFTLADNVNGIKYTPTTSADWNSVPATALAALDSLASTGIYKSQAQNLFFASPNGSAGLMSPRAIATADLPAGTVSPLTTKGDIYTYAAADARLPVGANGTVLTADSAQATGLRWGSALTSTLTNSHIFVGDVTNTATDVAVSGDLSLANTGAFTIANFAVTNAKIATATIDLTAKVTGILPVANGGTNSSASLTNNRVMISSGSMVVENPAIAVNRALASDGNGLPVASVTTATELGYVNGATSSLQAQINAKQASFTWFQESPAGAIDGANATFSLAHVPLADAAVHLKQDGLDLYQGVDYTISGATITTTVAPNFGQTLYADYVY